MLQCGLGDFAMRYFSSPTITTENYIVGKAVINGQLETVLLSDNGEKYSSMHFARRHLSLRKQHSLKQ